jgi:cell division protein FtsN
LIDRGRTLLQRAPLVPRPVWTAVGLGVAFGIGIVVGDVEPAHGATNAPPSDPLAIATARSDALDKTRAQLKLTFPQELQKPDKLTPVVDQPLPTAPAPAPAPAPVVAEQDDDDDKPIERPDPAALRAALSKVVGHESAVDATPAPKKGFALQVASVPTKAGADDLAKKLRGAGHDARVVEGEVGGRAVYRVRVGSFGDRAQADAYKTRITTPSFIVSE